MGTVGEGRWVEGMCWLTTGAACGRRGTNKPRFVTQVFSMRQLNPGGLADRY
jgi:hypothetical protein